jgi:hypothetical protein
METWGSQLQLKPNKGPVQSRFININSGIFQSDPLSQLVTCIELIPLTHELNRYKCDTMYVELKENNSFAIHE